MKLSTLSALFLVTTMNVGFAYGNSDCGTQYPEIAYHCAYQAKSGDSEVVNGNADHLYLSVAKKNAKESCEQATGERCVLVYCSEAFGAYSKAFIRGGTQTQSMGGSSPAARAYKKAVRQDKRKLFELREAAQSECPLNP